ncbi:serum amyloid P-component, partial [Austrofundulus limnaeus]|uniref:Pentraxin family member n=1 Tax=Austrofundulus limnaeus TaxID=52670 RepID=A0A2I4CK42_AUSLI
PARKSVKKTLLFILISRFFTDLSNKMFTFPQETNTAHVRLITSRQDLRAVTVCFRSFTELRKEHPLFSLSLRSEANGFLIYKMDTPGLFHVWVRNKQTSIEEQDYKLNRWTSICGTWDAESGLGQLWVDGKPSSRKYIISGSNINEPMIIVLGQV